MTIQQNRYRDPGKKFYPQVTPRVGSFRQPSYLSRGCMHLDSVLFTIFQIPPQKNPQILNKRYCQIIRTDKGVHLYCSFCRRYLMLFVDEYRGIFKQSPLLEAAQREALKDIDSKV